MSVNVSMFFGYHDSGVAFASNSEVLLCLQAERVFRRKHMRATAGEMEHLLHLGLQEINLRIQDVDTLFVSRWGCEVSRFVEVLGRRFSPVWTAHHANHVGLAASLGWDRALAVCADGGSENGCSAIYLFDGEQYDPIEDLDDTMLTGRFYGSITQLLFGASSEDSHIHLPGKAMGLSAFGRYDEEIANLLLDSWRELNVIDPSTISELARKFGLGNVFDHFDWRRWDFMHTAQRVWEEKWIERISKYRGLSDNCVFSGGCALNVQLNGRLHRSGLFKKFFVPPAPGDDGQAVGALVYHTGVKCQGPFLGRIWGQATAINEELVADLVGGNIVFWFDGRSELGPRALGHRSVLARADNIELRRKLNEGVKGREWYRPVAPIILREHANEWFEMAGDTPWMSEAVVARVITKTNAPGVVHVDGTSRVQTLSFEHEPFLHEILTRYERETRVPMLMNTSMNLPGEPICDSPDDAKETFLRSSADVLYVHGQRFTRESFL